MITSDSDDIEDTIRACLCVIKDNNLNIEKMEIKIFPFFYIWALWNIAYSVYFEFILLFCFYMSYRKRNWEWNIYQRILEYCRALN